MHALPLPYAFVVPIAEAIRDADRHARHTTIAANDCHNAKFLTPCRTIIQDLALCIERFSRANGFGISFALLYAEQEKWLKATNRSRVPNT
jgi:hypothetical protein